MHEDKSDGNRDNPSYVRFWLGHGCERDARRRMKSNSFRKLRIWGHGTKKMKDKIEFYLSFFSRYQTPPRCLSHGIRSR